MKKNVPALLDMNAAECDKALQTMSTEQFLYEAQAIIEFIKGAHKNWTVSDQKIIDTCQSVLKSGNAESFEERKYFMETMKEAAHNKDIKSAITIGVGAFAGIGILAAIIIKSISKN